MVAKISDLIVVFGNTFVICQHGVLAVYGGRHNATCISGSFTGRVEVADAYVGQRNLVAGYAHRRRCT